MLQATQHQQHSPPSPTSEPKPPGDFFSTVGANGPVTQIHPRSFSVSAAGDDALVSNDNHEPTEGSDVRRSRSMKTPARANLTGMSSFSAAGSNLATSPSSSAASGYTPPAAARFSLFSHHAIAPAVPTAAAAPRPFSPALTSMSDPGPDDAVFSTDGSRPVSPTGSTTSSGPLSPASLFLSQFSSRSTAGEAPPAPDAQGSRVLDYILGKVLGRGGFSTVREAKHVETGELFACKIVKRDDLSDTSGSLEQFEAEIELWKHLPLHKSLIPLIETHRTSYATFLIMPLLPGGTLLDILKREGGNENTARKWFPGVVDAVAALHEGFEGCEGHILHGDLKLDNLIVDVHGVVKLGDFGMAQKVSASGKRHPPTLEGSGRPSNLPPHMQVRGRLSTAPPAHSRGPSQSPNRRRDTISTLDVNATPNPPCPSASLPYAPPELLGSAPVVPSLSQDMWAVGVILHALLTNRLPFNDTFDPRLQMKILRGQWDQPHHLGYEWMEVLHGCMNRDIHRRWDINRVRESDALVGWQSVKPKSRSRSRARMAMDPSHDHRGRRQPDSPVHHRGQYTGDAPMSGRGRDRSRSAVRPSTQAHHRGPSFHEDTHLMHLQDPSARSRSKSATRNPNLPRGRVGPAPHDAHHGHGHGPRFTPDKLAAELEGVAITRGRSKQRVHVDHPSPNDSVVSLVVPESSSSRSPSATRRPLSGSQDWIPGDGRRAQSRPRSGHSVHSVPGSAAWWDAHDRENVSGTSSGAHTPSRATSRTRGSPSGPSTHPEPFVVGSRPPTLGFELDVVDEDAPERGRSPALRGRAANRSKSRGRLQL